jgi:hypothetical protein
VQLSRLDCGPGAITAAYCVFGFAEALPRPVGGQTAIQVPVDAPGAWISRPRGSAILTGIRQQVLCSYYPQNMEAEKIRISPFS